MYNHPVTPIKFNSIRLFAVHSIIQLPLR